MEMQQKHIKVANHSEFGSMVEHYESHPLAEDSDDEKSEKAEKKAERAANKRQRGGGSARNKRKCWPRPAGPSSRQRAPAHPSSRSTPSIITPGTSEATYPFARALFLLWVIQSLSEVMPEENTSQQG